MSIIVYLLCRQFKGRQVGMRENRNPLDQQMPVTFPLFHQLQTEKIEIAKVPGQKGPWSTE